MHGRPRKAATQEEEEASAIKASKLKSLQSQFLQFHHNKVYTKEALDVSAKLLESNPEYYTAWNYRKLAVHHNLNLNEADENNEEFIKSILDEELRLVENALKRNFKSYGAWHHRKWVLGKGHSSTDRELLLLGKFQKADARNFHAWNYRRFVTTLKNIPDEKELEYTTDMICDNFSNYSAWHNRSVLLSRLLKEKAKGYSPKDNVLTEEYEFVRHALFTDPDDQSGWFYHLWLLDQIIKVETLMVSSWPPHGCNLSLSLDGSFGDCSLSPFTGPQSNARTLPLILYFSEAVENICPSTVEVECENIVSNELVWRSLSGDETGSAQTWLTYLNFPEDLTNSLKAYQVKVSLGRSQGILSSTGIHHGNHIAFTVSVPPHCSEHVDLRNEEKISWSEERFCTHEAQFVESVLVNLFHLERINVDDKVVDYQWNINTVNNEIAHCRDLLSTMNCKIGKLTLARLLMVHDTLMSYTGTSHTNGNHHAEILQLYDDLKETDPAHFHYYGDEYSLVLLKQIISDQELLLKHCCKYKYPSSPRINNFCLRLNNLSLSRIGSMEQLLWVQVVDLSYNQLQSLEGLEVMQLLSCLNVSHNKLRSFTALEPLRLLRSLQVVDISHNKIGEHSIDTRRYLCASPLNHRSEGDWIPEESEMHWAEVADYWEAYTIFKDLSLIQLDVIGNAVSDEKLKLLLIKLLPSLKWLDGEKVADN